MPHINIRDLGRVGEISAVLVRHGFGHLVRNAGFEVPAAAPEGSPSDRARRIRMVLSDLGPTFVKLGQVLSVRPDIVPRDVMDELTLLQDNVSPAPPEEIRALLELELGGEISDRFQVFDHEPIASASIAQVHRAVLLDGTEVAVKVQRPGIEDRIRSDLHILYSLAHVVQGNLELPGLYTPVAIVREFEAAIHQELDFLQEASAAARFRANFAGNDNIVAPEVHPEWSTRRVLVMEMLRGRRIMDLRGDPAAEGLMDHLIEASFMQVFEHGFFHGDPHPGNLLLLEDGRLGYLDFGLTGRLTGEMQDVIVALFISLVNRDAESMALTLYRAGATDGRVDLMGFKRDIERLLGKYHGATLAELGARTSLVEFIQVAARYRIRLVPEYAVLARAASILDGIAREMMPDTDIVARVGPYAQRLIGQRFNPERLSADVWRLLQHAHFAMNDIPLRLNQLMGDVERGSLRVRTVDDDGAALREEIRHAGVRVAMALCTAALSVSGAVMMAAWPVSLWGLPVLPLLGAAVALLGIAVFGGLLAHYLFAARIHPREWRRRAIAIMRFFVGPRGG